MHLYFICMPRRLIHYCSCLWLSTDLKLSCHLGCIYLKWDCTTPSHVSSHRGRLSPPDAHGGEELESVPELDITDIPLVEPFAVLVSNISPAVEPAALAEAFAGLEVSLGQAADCWYWAFAVMASLPIGWIAVDTGFHFASLLCPVF